MIAPFRERLARSAGAAAGSFISIGIAWCVARALHGSFVAALVTMFVITAATHAWADR